MEIKKMSRKEKKKERKKNPGKDSERPYMFLLSTDIYHVVV